MGSLRDLHLSFRREDIQGRESRRREWDARQAGVPEAQPECLKAIHCDAKDDGKCRWCGRKCDFPVPRPRPPYDENQGDVLKREAYEYYWVPDETDLPYWYQGAGREMA